VDIDAKRHVQFDRLHNFRDLGGYRAADGRAVRWGRLYRSDSLAKLRGDDAARFAALGVRTVVDLRYPFEIERWGRVPPAGGVAYHNCSIEHRPFDQSQLSGRTDPVRFLADRYAEVAADGAEEIGQALRIIAAGDAPLVMHCASGKDRTGIMAAIILSLLGVAEADIVADYALTELATPGLIADWKDAHPDRELRWPYYGRAPGEIIEVFLAELSARHGCANDYVTGYLRLPGQLIEDLRGSYLDQ
jgi:protein-tyrosine phosphatase